MKEICLLIERVDADTTDQIHNNIVFTLISEIMFSLSNFMLFSLQNHAELTSLLSLKSEA